MADWDGAEYRKVSDLQQWLADRALAGLDDLDIGSVHDLLDVGCGDGRITAEIARRIPGARVVGLDPSPRMLELAPRSERLRFELGDVSSMRYADAFDAVVSFNALHWVHDQQRALDRISAALRPGGWALLVFVCGGGSRPSLEDVAMDVTRRPSWAADFAGFEQPYVHPEVPAWLARAADAGLTRLGHAVDDLEWDFGSRETFARWCAVGFGGWTDRLPRDARQAFVDEVVDAYERVAGRPGLFRFRQLRAHLERRPGRGC